MFRRYYKIIGVLALGLALLVAACATAPYTGRRQIILGSEEGEISTGAQTYEKLRARNDTCQDPALNELVTRVGNRIAAAADRPDYHGECVVLETPGDPRRLLSRGPVGHLHRRPEVHPDEAGLATVLAQSMGHALARHTGERQSQATLAHMGAGTRMAVGGVGGLAGQAPSARVTVRGSSMGSCPLTAGHKYWRPIRSAHPHGQGGLCPALAMDFWRA